MTGTTSPADSPAGRAAAAARALYKQEDFLQGLRGLSEDDLRERMKETVALERVALQEWLDSGDCFIVSLAGKVHVPSCDSMRRYVDRDNAWGWNLRFPDRLLDTTDEDRIPVWPLLKTRAQIEQVPRYNACPLCVPDLVNVGKPSRKIVWTYLAARSLKSKHLGTEFRLGEGTLLGALTKITTVETIDGLAFTAEFEHAEAPVTDPATELMYRTGTRPQAS